LSGVRATKGTKYASKTIDYAGKACQGQTFVNYGLKRFIRYGPGLIMNSRFHKLACKNYPGRNVIFFSSLTL
jgi:hypothetical protein